jgi:pimeloyl-ACP methyl ester carboxylesterase
VLALGLSGQPVQAEELFDRWALKASNRRLHGKVLDFTNNHGIEHRLWSEALKQQRDLYVYVPPGFDPRQLYPVMIWLHGFAQDEHTFLEDVIVHLDRAIACGKLPPLIIAAPDGSLRGRVCLFGGGSFFLNTKAGAFEDFVIHDVWGFVQRHFPIRPEPEAHVLAGVSMGGGAAFNLGIKYRDQFKVVFGIFPPLNDRWMDCHGRYMSKFDPCCWGWRTDFSRGHEVIGRFGIIPIKLKQIIDPLYDRKSGQAAEEVSRENPIEMIDRLNLRPGDLAMYVAYGGRDQFNIDAQVESFLYLAKHRGLCVDVGYEPKGRHDLATALKLMPGLLDWLGPRLMPYGPPFSGCK